MGLASSHIRGRERSRRLFFVVAVQCPAARHDGFLGDRERARSMGVATEKKMDLVRDERQCRMETPQPTLRRARSS